MTANTNSTKSYHLVCTGKALETANAHNAPANVTLFGSCFCPFVQRTWVAFEYLGIDYHVLNPGLADSDLGEVDPYKKPAELLEVSPKGLVPGLKLNDHDPPRAVNESTVILDLLEDLASTSAKRSLLPSVFDPCSSFFSCGHRTQDSRALIRLQADHVNRTLVPAFYRYLQAQEEDKQIEGAREFVDALSGLVSLFERAKNESTSDVGLWNGRGKLSLADVMVAPWIFRATNVLFHYRGFILPEGGNFRAYVDSLLKFPAFQQTCSTEQLYLDSYERYAHDRPNTSQVANAINSGRGLP